jgi:hypothetical protein
VTSQIGTWRSVFGFLGQCLTVSKPSAVFARLWFDASAWFENGDTVPFLDVWLVSVAIGAPRGCRVTQGALERAAIQLAAPALH